MRVVKAVLVAAVFGAPWMTPCARADVSVKVSADAVELDAHDATVEDVLASLEAARDLHHRATIPLDRTISGTYKGTLRSVVSLLLAGYDFVLKGSQDRLEVTILGLSGTKGQISPRTGQPAPTQDANTQSTPTSESIAKNELTVPQSASAPTVAAASAAKPSVVDSMLLNVAQASSGPPAPAADSATNAGAVPSMPSPAAIAALTQKAAAQLDALLTSLQRVQP